MRLNRADLKVFLDEKVDLYNRPAFIESDPVSIPHLYSKREDIEISGFLAATIAWGNRKMILRNANRMMELIGNSPYDFIMNSCEDDIAGIERFVHRTFNTVDFIFFIESLKNIYKNHGGLEAIFTKYQGCDSLQPAIHEFHRIFFEPAHEKRTERHVSDPYKGSAAKKINMFLRMIKVA
jgi:uncharacterized protein (TIGR02757 family)